MLLNTLNAMTMIKHYDSFEGMISELEKKGRPIHLLTGNGFSMAYDHKIFSYNALANFVENAGDPTVSVLFEALKTKNFELIMEQLTTFSLLLKALDAEKGLQDKVAQAHEKLKKSLLDAVKELHPEHVFKIDVLSIQKCAQFLNRFMRSGGHIFSTNYDLLLYWVLMRAELEGAIDGFGRELLNPLEVASKTEEADFSELRWGPHRENQNIHHLHGTLPIFDSRTEIIKERYSDEGYLLENIGRRLDRGHYPIFVTAGKAADKLDLILHNRYLTHCYDQLCGIDGSLITYGFGFGEYDDHLIDALNKAHHAQHKNPPKLWSIYIGVFSDVDRQHIQNISHKFHAPVRTFDVRSFNPWH